MTVQSATILRDVTYFIKNYLSTVLTDPISSSRASGEAFIMTSYPTRPVRYPLITIKDLNSQVIQRLGFQSQATYNSVTMEVRVWGRNVKERDSLADSIFQLLKDNQIGANGTSQSMDLHDFKLVSSVNLDDPDGAKSKIMTFGYTLVAT